MKKHIVLLCGGQSPEHDISLLSAKNIYTHINKERFDFSLVYIDKNGSWYKQDSLENIVCDEKKRIIVVPGGGKKSFSFLDKMQDFPQIDCIFPILHGENGEDGKIQAFCDVLGVPFVGSDMTSSALCMNKLHTKELLDYHGVTVAPFDVLYKKDSYNEHYFDSLKEKFGIPLFVKPVSTGSSMGVSKVKNYEDFKKAFEEAFSFSSQILVEKAIIGDEIECGVIEKEGDLYVSVCGKIVQDPDILYDYHTKYFEKNPISLEIPAKIDEKSHKNIQKLAKKVCMILGCGKMARVDVFFTRDKQIIVNEVNTIPGFTRFSMFPLLWEASGISYEALITVLIENALQK